MQPITSFLNPAQGMNVREAMNRFRAERTDTVQRLLTKAAAREDHSAISANTPSKRPSDPTGRLGPTIDIQA